jgi:hypothetical protein
VREQDAGTGQDQDAANPSGRRRVAFRFAIELALLDESHVPRFEMIAAIRGANTIAKPAPEPSGRGGIIRPSYASPGTALNDLRVFSPLPLAGEGRVRALLGRANQLALIPALSREAGEGELRARWNDYSIG